MLCGILLCESHEVVFVLNLQLVLKRITPVAVLSQVPQSAFKTTLEEVLGHAEALQLVHCLHLLVALTPGLLEHLVLVLDALDLALDFFLPAIVLAHLSLLVFAFVLSDFIELSFFFDFQEGLLH